MLAVGVILRISTTIGAIVRKIRYLTMFLSIALVTGCTPDRAGDQSGAHLEHPFLFHLVQADLWEAAVSGNAEYFPPTYDQDGFTHATANPDLLLNVANHFYQDVPGRWMCLRMTLDSLKAVGTKVVFEGTAPVGDKEADFSGTDDELFPHVMGGIKPAAVIEAHSVTRSQDGKFLAVVGVTSN